MAVKKARASTATPTRHRTGTSAFLSPRVYQELLVRQGMLTAELRKRVSLDQVLVGVFDKIGWVTDDDGKGKERRDRG